MRKTILFLSLALLLASCGGNTVTDNEEVSSNQPEEEIISYNPELLFTIFDSETINSNFKSLDLIMPKVDINTSETPSELPRGEKVNTVQMSYSFLDNETTVGEMLGRTATNSYMVIKDGKVVDEVYFNGYNEKDKITSWSVAKSVLSMLVGIAVEEGKIESIDDLVTKYVPTLEGSGYAGVTVKQVLQMSSGVKFNEDYTDLESDIMQLMPYLVLDSGSMDDFTATLQNEVEPGTFVYKSIDTQVIGMILKGAVGKSASEYLEEKIWKPLNMSSDSYWSTDLQGNDLSFAFLNATIDDYSKLGLLALNGGDFEGTSIVPSQWLVESVTPAKDDLKEGVADPYFGYGYQWWIPYGATYGEEFVAMGIYGQYIYVNKKYDVVITKFSSDETIIMNDAEVLEAFRAVASRI